MSDSVLGTQSTHWQPYTYLFEHWEFRNKPKPDPIPDEQRWEAAMDGRPREHHVGVDYRDELKEDERLVVYQVWVQHPSTPDWPVVMFTHTSRRKALRFITDQRKRLSMRGCRFAVVACAAPKMPEPAENSPGA